MAIKNIKEIINNKGYVIDPKDRKIFEDGDLQSFFGFSSSDAIEFIIYDANDNQLPQLNGDLVRYINLTDENIRDYFLIPEGTLIQKNSLPTEYFIDVERLLQEAGYSNGIFKTQVSLINKRAGSEKEFDKLWIQEISPSRNEIRLFPLKKGTEINSELKQRFEIFVRGSQFRDDVIQIAFEVIEQLSPDTIASFLRNKYGTKWVNNFLTEFKINNLDIFATQIHESFLKSALYDFTNRHSKIGENNYGTNKLIPPPLSMSKNDIVNTIKRILIETILYYLPERDINNNKQTVEDFLESEDYVTDVLQTEKSDTQVPPKVVAIEEINIIKTNNPIQENLISEVIEEIIEDGGNDSNSSSDIEIKTPDGDPDIGDVLTDISDTNPIEDDDFVLNFDDFFDIVDDVVVLKPIETNDTGIDYNDDRVDIPNEIVIDDKVFEITPLPIDIAGGSPISGEGDPGSPSPGAGATSSPNAPIGNREFSNPQEAIDNEFRYRTRKVIREL